MGKEIQMMNFNSNTYESIGSFSELTIDTKVMFPSFKSIQHIDYEKLKRKLLEAVWESVTLAKEEGAAN